MFNECIAAIASFFLGAHSPTPPNLLAQPALTARIQPASAVPSSTPVVLVSAADKTSTPTVVIDPQDTAVAKYFPKTLANRAHDVDPSERARYFTDIERLRQANSVNIQEFDEPAFQIFVRERESDHLTYGRVWAEQKKPLNAVLGKDFADFAVERARATPSTLDAFYAAMFGFIPWPGARVGVALAFAWVSGKLIDTFFIRIPGDIMTAYLSSPLGPIVGKAGVLSSRHLGWLNTINTAFVNRGDGVPRPGLFRRALKWHRGRRGRVAPEAATTSGGDQAPLDGTAESDAGARNKPKLFGWFRRRARASVGTPVGDPEPGASASAVVPGNVTPIKPIVNSPDGGETPKPPVSRAPMNMMVADGLHLPMSDNMIRRNLEVLKRRWMAYVRVMTSLFTGEMTHGRDIMTQNLHWRENHLGQMIAAQLTHRNSAHILVETFIDRVVRDYRSPDVDPRGIHQLFSELTAEREAAMSQRVDLSRPAPSTERYDWLCRQILHLAPQSEGLLLEIIEKHAEQVMADERIIVVLVLQALQDLSFPEHNRGLEEYDEVRKFQKVIRERYNIVAIARAYENKVADNLRLIGLEANQYEDGWRLVDTEHQRVHLQGLAVELAAFMRVNEGPPCDKILAAAE